MAYLNRAFLIGNLTRDPELRTTPKGTAIATFSLAVNRTYRDESGASHDETTFVDIEAWGKQAELVSKYLTKGSPCMIEGRLRLDTWEDKTSGQKRSRLKVVLDNVQFLNRAPAHGESTAPRTTGQPPPAAPASDDISEDVPF